MLILLQGQAVAAQGWCKIGQECVTMLSFGCKLHLKISKVLKVMLEMFSITKSVRDVDVHSYRQQLAILALFFAFVPFENLLSLSSHRPSLTYMKIVVNCH